MKKLTLIFLAIITLLAFTSCSDGKKQQKEPEKVALENVYLTEKFALPENVDIYEIYVSGDSVFLKGSEEEHFVNEETEAEEYKYYDVVYVTDKTFSNFEKYFSFESEYFWDQETQESRSTYFNNAFSDNNGGLWISVSSYYSKPLDENYEEWINENNTTLHHYNANGEEVATLDCSDIFAKIPDIDTTELDNVYINNFNQANDGTIYITTNSRVTALSPDGNVLKTKLLDDTKNIGNSSIAENGNLRAVCFDWSGDESKAQIVEYDVNANQFKTLSDISINDNIFMDHKGNVYANDYYTISRVDPATGEKTPILDWINSDINCDRIFQTIALDGEFYTFEWDANYDKRNLLHLTPAGEGDTVEKYVMTLAANTISGDIKNMIIDFNRSSADYRIQVKAYGWDEASTDKFDLDLLSGNVPDLICLDNLNAEKYATKGMFADLGAMLDADEDISREDFLPNILKASEIKGKLYRLPTSFSIRSLIGKTSVVGDRVTWTWEDFVKLMKQYPDAEMISEFSRATLMETFLPLVIGDFIDYNTGKSNFTDGSFANFLEFAKTLPPEIDWDKYYEDIDWEEYDNRFKNNQTLLAISYLSTLDGDYYTAENFGEPVTYIGYPTTSDNGNSIQFSSQFAIGAKSIYKEQAWNFLKMVFEEEYQTDFVWDIPVIKTVFDKKKQEAIKNVNGMNDEKDYPVFEEEIMPDVEVEYEEDATEEIVVDEELVEEEIIVDDVIMSKPIIGMPSPMLPYDGEEDLEARKAKMLKNIEDVSRIATSATRLIRVNDPMIEVITTEVAPYFDGKKSLEETCTIIESRVNLYLAENM